MREHTTMITADDLMLMEAPGERLALERGELVRDPPAGFDHGAIGLAVGSSLLAHERATGAGRAVAGDTGFVLERDPDTVRAPEAAFVCRERIAQLGRIVGYFPGAPDLCVEVVSPSDTVSRVDAKVEQWLAHGTRVVIVVDPFAQLATIHRHNQKPVVVARGESLEAPDVLPGWSLPLTDVF